MSRIIVAVLLLGIILLSNLFACDSYASDESVESTARDSLENFFLAAKEHDMDKVWDLCYKPSYDSKSDIVNYIDRGYDQYFKHYDYINVEVTNSGIVEDSLIKQMIGKNFSIFTGVVVFTNGEQLSLEAQIVEDKHEWKIALIDL